MVVAPTTRPVGRPKGARVLDPKREFLIHDAIRNFYLRPLRPKFSELVQEIGQRCRAERLPPPNWRTIKSRVQDVLAQNGRR
jgi:putative transposase